MTTLKQLSLRQQQYLQQILTLQDTLTVMHADLVLQQQSKKKVCRTK